MRGGSLLVFCASASQFGCQGVDVAKASEAWGVGGMLVRRIFSKRGFALSPGCSVPNFSWKDVLVAGRFITSRIGTVGLSISYSTKNPLTLSNANFVKWKVVMHGHIFCIAAILTKIKILLKKRN